MGPNGCASNTAGTLTGGNALYTASYSYDTLDRLTSGPAGSSYTYGDPNHLHAATSTSGGYSASYDAGGNMLCRAPTSATTCAGTQTGWTGAQLGYDNEGRLASWQNAPGSSPTSTDAFASDGEGSRIAQKVVSNGVSTTTDYLLGGLEEASSTSLSSTLTEYYPIPGIGTAVRVSSGSSSTLSYLASDNLGSVTVALSSGGSVTAQQLYGPYGTVRYQSGQMPTAHGYTGQIADAQTGLSYYGARYYDPALGEFTSADTEIDGGLDRYAYVGDSPCTYNDPSGHCPQKRPDNVPRWKKIVLWVATVITLGRARGDVGTPQNYSGPSDFGGGAPRQTVQGEPQRPIIGGSGDGCGGDGGPGKGKGGAGGTATIYVGGAEAPPEGDQTTEGSSGSKESPGSQQGTGSGNTGGQGSGTGSGTGTGSNASIVPGRGWARWMSYEAEQDWQAQLAQIQDARTAHLEQIETYDQAPGWSLVCNVALASASGSGCGGGQPTNPIFGQPPQQQPAQNPVSQPSDPPPVQIPDVPPIAAWLLARELSML